MSNQATAVRDEINELMNQPSTSTWLKTALQSALSRDCVDVANDAEVLRNILDRHAAEKLGVSVRVSNHSPKSTPPAAEQ